jgi:hypothetical protein
MQSKMASFVLPDGRFTLMEYRFDPSASKPGALPVLNVKPLVQTSFRSFPPAYPLLHIDAYSAALEKATRPEDINPVLLITLPNAPTACCHLQYQYL